jgi:hypothetical protein
MPPCFETMRNSPELLVADVVVALMLVELAGLKSNWVPTTIRMFLGEDTAEGIVGHIVFCTSGKVGVEDAKDECGREDTFEVLKCKLALGIPSEGLIFSEKVSQGGGNVGVEVDEAAVIVGEAKERHHVMLVVGYSPLGDGFNFGGVSGDAVVVNDMADKLNGMFGKRTFLKLGVELVAAEFVEDKTNVLEVGFEIRREDKDVVKVNNEEGVGVRV